MGLVQRQNIKNKPK